MLSLVLIMVLWGFGIVATETCPEGPEIRIVKAYPEKNYAVLPNNTDTLGSKPNQVIYFSEPSNLVLQCASRQPVLWDIGNDIKLKQFRYIRPSRTSEDVFNTTTYCFRINLFIYRQNNATGKYSCRMLHETRNTSLFIFMQNHKRNPFINAGEPKVIERPNIVDNWLQIPCIAYNPSVPVDLYIVRNGTLKVETEVDSLRWNSLEGFWLNMKENPNCTSPCHFICKATGNNTGTDQVHILRSEKSSGKPNVTLVSTGEDFVCTGEHVEALTFKRCSNIMECYNTERSPPRSKDTNGVPCDSLRRRDSTCLKVQPPPFSLTNLVSGIIKCTAGASRDSELVSTALYRFFGQPSALPRHKTYEELLNIFSTGPSMGLSALAIRGDLHPKAYVGQSVTISCFASQFILAEGIEWALGMANGSQVGKKQVNFRTTFAFDGDRPDFEMSTNLTFTPWSTEIKNVVCMGPSWTDFSWINDTISIIVLGGEEPTFEELDGGLENTFFTGEMDKTLTCIARGDPKPTITWKKDGKELPPGVLTANKTQDYSSTSSKTQKSVLSFPSVVEFMKGEYTCTAETFAGSKSQTFVVDVKRTKGPLIGMIVGATIAIVILVAAVVYLYKHLILQRKIIAQFLNEKEVQEFFYGVPEMIKNKDCCTTEFSQFLPYRKEYEILPTSIRIENEEVLGSGQYGTVFKGVLAIDDQERRVAVKTVKQSADKEYVKALLSEIKIMMTIGSHPNVVNFIGALTKDIRDGKLLVVVELCGNGSLEKYLRNYRNNYIDQIQDDAIVVPEDWVDSTLGYNCDNKPLGTHTLVTWASEIAAGMEYLESKKVIHADLACRNILVTDYRTVKITDFGLSRQLYESSDYVKKTQVPLPWRWMALESLKDMTFSIYSDIWSYGVTLWEIFSLGAIPYPGYNWDQEFLKKLEAGLRVDKPEFATSQIYFTMLKCMERDPEQRLTFTNAKTIFQELIKSFPSTQSGHQYSEVAF